MINCNRINEDVMKEMRRRGVGTKQISEDVEGKTSKRIDVKVTTKSGNHWTTGFNGTLEEAKKYFVGHKFEGETPVVSVTLVSGTVKEDEDSKEVGTEDKQFDAKKVDKDGIEKKPEGTDTTHDEGEEEKDDPTREKLETPKDEADEKKGGPAELAADIRVSIRIEKMGLGRYRRMLAKHELSKDDEKWLKERIGHLEGCIKDMEDKLPELEKEADSGAVKEHMRAGLRKAIVEIAG